MRKLNLPNNTYFSLSLLMHVAIILLLIWHVHHSLSTRIPSPTKHIIDVSLLALKSPPKQSHTTSPLPIHTHGRITVKQMQAPVVQHQIQHKKQQRNISGKQLNQLIAYLYHQIGFHKHYPAQAQSLQETGVATVGFTLLPSGQIEDMQVTHSSGYVDLDQAALQTMHAAAPFTQVHLFLHHAQRFALPIAFRLSE